MSINKLLIAAIAGAAFAWGAASTDAGVKEEFVELKTVPAAVQKTIKAKADGGQIVSIKKETKEGKVIYEALIKKNGKQWDFEVEANGKYVDQKDEGKEGQDKGEKNEKEED